MGAETLEEKEKRIFESYKQDLIKIANVLKNEGLEIVFDDSSISQKENSIKKRKLENYRLI